jgi:alpha-tubulin suppressor-like RCC1 family protein
MNSNGQIGDGTTINRFFPVSINTSGVLSGKKIIQITTGDYHTCIIANDLNSYCWGKNELIFLNFF